jgi:hypothetical protein
MFTQSALPETAKHEDGAQNNKDAQKSTVRIKDIHAGVLSRCNCNCVRVQMPTKVVFPLDDATKVKVNAALKFFGVTRATGE